MIAVILAGGEGSRAGGGLPKQFRLLCDRPLLWWSMKAFVSACPDVRFVVVVHPSHFATLDALWNELPEGERFRYQEVCGGRSRVESVANALLEIDADADEIIAVHDAARPLVDSELIGRGIGCTCEKGSAVPVIPLSDSIRKLTSEGSLPVDRAGYVAVQTPQFFKFGILSDAYRRVADPRFTDDASIVQEAGGEVALFQGSPDNMKVTNPSDFVIAEALMRSRSL